MCAFTFESGSYVALVFDPPACSSQVLALQACTPYPAENTFSDSQTAVSVRTDTCDIMRWESLAFP